MSKEKGKTQNKKRKLTRQEKKQIDALIRQSKGDGKPHTAQDSIPFERMYKDGICRLANGRYSKCIEFEDINYQLAQPDDKTAIFEALCDMYNSFDASISVQLPVWFLPPQRIVSSAALNVCRDLRQLPASMQTQYRRFPARSRKRTQAASRLSFRDLRYSLSQPLRLI